jgi:four helix bundle protein
MRIEKFEDVKSWQKGKLLYKDVYRLFLADKDYSFKDQIFRATLSITNNIAEGFDRGSDRELRQFLIIARGSCAEVRSMLLIASDVNKISKHDSEKVIASTYEISRLLSGFIRKLTTNDRRPVTSE